MKKTVKLLGVAALAAAIISGLAACDNGTTSTTNSGGGGGGGGGGTDSTPVAADYDIAGLSQAYDGQPKAVTVTPKAGKSTGAVTVYYEGVPPAAYAKNAAAPSAEGQYTVTFDVAAVTGWNAAAGLAAGTLEIGHTHTWGAEWKYDAAQHWRECTSGDGAKTDLAAHDGTMPCTVCGYDARRLQLTGQVHEYDDTGDDDVIAGPLTGVSATLDTFDDRAGDYPVTDHFTGSAAVTNGEITVDLTPKETGLLPFSATYNGYISEPQEICDPNAEGLMFTSLVDNDDMYPSLMKTDGEGVITHQLIFIYMDRDITFTAWTAYHRLNGLSVKEGWNYISKDLVTNVCEVITDLSGYKWINY